MERKASEYTVILSKDGHFEELVDAEGRIVHCEIEEIDDEIVVEAESCAVGEWYPDEQYPDIDFAYCGNCFKKADETELQLCAGCGVEAYCAGTNCQALHWKSKVNAHKDICAKLAQGLHNFDKKGAINAELDDSDSDSIGEDYSYESSSEEEIAEESGPTVDQRGGRRGGGRRGGGRRGGGRRGGGRRGGGRRGGRGRPGRGGGRGGARNRMRRRWRRARGYGSWSRRFRGRRWFRPGLYRWYTHWFPLWPFVYATDAFLYTPKDSSFDPDWYFNPNSDPSLIEAKRRVLMVRYADAVDRGYGIVPDMDMGRFRWIKRA